MLRDDVQDKLVETLELLQRAIRLMSEPTVVRDDVGVKGCPEVAPARRMWKRWVKPLKDGDICDALWKDHEKDRGRDPGSRIPVTILPGHSAVEEIEREAYERGYEKCRADYLIEEYEFKFPRAIDGVEPVVVDAFTWKHLMTPFDHRHSATGHVAAYESAGGVISTPIRILMYHGIGPDGKRVES